MAQAGRIAELKHDVSILKTTPMFSKPVQAEKVIDRIVVILAEMDVELFKLLEDKNHEHRN